MVFSGSCLFKRIIFCWQKNVIKKKKKWFNFINPYVDAMLRGSYTVKNHRLCTTVVNLKPNVTIQLKTARFPGVISR